AIMLEGLGGSNKNIDSPSCRLGLVRIGNSNFCSTAINVNPVGNLKNRELEIVRGFYQYGIVVLTDTLGFYESHPQERDDGAKPGVDLKEEEPLPPMSEQGFRPGIGNDGKLSG